MKKNILIVIPCLVLLTIIVLLLTGKVYLIDDVYNLVVMHNDCLTNFFRCITNFGSFWVIIVFSVVLLVIYKNKKDLLSLYSAIVLSTILNNVLKLIFVRPRPALIHLVEENSYSFPSGHASAVMTFYGYLIYMVWKSSWCKASKIGWTAILSLIILIVGYSRIYLNVHYISDVLAGYTVSLIFLYIFIKLKKTL